MRWRLSSSSDPAALALVDGRAAKLDLFAPKIDVDPHYSRRTPGSETFTGVGQEVVLVTECGRAVWACVRQKTPQARGSGLSRGRSAGTDNRARFVFRNIVFRNLGAGLSSALIAAAVEATEREWIARYGAVPEERLRTEVDVRRLAARSPGHNPGYCYLMAGWERGETRRGKLILWAPRAQALA